MSSYKLSLNSVRSINRTIVAVNQMRKTGIAGDLPFRQNARKGDKGGNSGGATLQIGKTTAAWAKGDEATIDVYKKEDRTPAKDESGQQITAQVFNLFANIGEDKWVAWMSGHLVAAECD